MKTVVIWLTAVGCVVASIIVLMSVIYGQISMGLIFYGLLAIWLAYVNWKTIKGTASKSTQILGGVAGTLLAILQMYLLAILLGWLQ